MDIFTRRLAMGAAGAGSTKTYIDDVFHTQLFKSTNQNADYKVTNNIDNSGEGGFLWYKDRVGSSWHLLWDTVRGSNKYIYSNSNSPQSTGVLLKSFDADGYTIQTGTTLLDPARENVLWNFRKTTGFLDIIYYSGSGGARTIAHDLGSVPGCIMIKCTTHDENWSVYHGGYESTPENNNLSLNTNDQAFSSSSYWNGTAPTSTHFSLKNFGGSNDSGKDYVAYVFAGGESTAATARSVDFDNDDGLNVAASSDFNFGTGQFCIECWVYVDNLPATGSPSYGRVFQLDGPTGNSSYTNFQVTINPGDGTIHAWAYGGGNPVGISGSKNLKNGQWHHIAVNRDSNNVITQYVDGIPDGTVTATTNFNPNSGSPRPRIGSYDNGGTNGVFNGKISNLRVTVGEPVYTSAFKPSTTPLTTSSQGATASNVKLLCCNNSSTTGSTVTSGTITDNSDPTASTTSPFDDPEGFQFGEGGDQNLIKCGSYKGNGSANGPDVYVGWEPSWVMVKNTSSTGLWLMADNMRGVFTQNGSGAEDDPYLQANDSNAEYTSYNWIEFTSRGFKLRNTGASLNASGSSYVYIAIRRPDGLVGKPANVGTDVFDMKVAQTGGSTPWIQGYGFVVDSIITKAPTSSGDWHIYQRLTGKGKLEANTTNAEATNNNSLWDYMDGWNQYTGNDGYFLGWGWKRGAGFDVVTDKGNGQTTKTIGHGLGVVPEMIWRKNRDGGSDSWQVYHIGLNGGTNPYLYRIYINASTAESNDQWTWDSAPTATHFTVGSNGAVNRNNENFTTMLFASVDKISKVGYYTGTGVSGLAVTTGFAPRFLIIKNASWSHGDWFVYDTTRGWTSGTDAVLMINSTGAQSTTGTHATNPTSTGFTIESTDAAVNQNGHTFIYYAHA